MQPLYHDKKVWPAAQQALAAALLGHTFAGVCACGNTLIVRRMNSR
jgi:hypothetical protein